MSFPLQEHLRLLEALLPVLRERRASDAFANDVFEAATYWHELGRWLFEGNTKVNYPARAREEKLLLSKLEGSLQRSLPSEREMYARVFDVAERVLDEVESARLSAEGYLGTVATVKREFSFLETDYHFVIVEEQPLGVRYSSGAVFIHLEYSEQPFLSCLYGPEKSEVSFSIDDLLYLYGDSRYREMQGRRILQTRVQVEEWFILLAEIWKQYGHEVLSNQHAIFARLLEAQSKRDLEYAAAMSKRYGASDPDQTR